MTRVALLLAILIVAFAGCSSSNAPCPGVVDPTGPFTITGHLQFVQPTSIPTGAALICYWPETNLNPYSHTTFDTSRIFGHGTIDATTNTFSITLQGLPPGIAHGKSTTSCNAVDMAPAGYIILVSNLVGGNSGQNYFDNKALLGAVDSVAILYYASNFTMKSWQGTFPQGYSTLRDSNYTHGDTSFTAHLATTNTALVLRVDSTSQSNFHFPYNWLYSPAGY
jgi:hypothetical protein